MDLPLDSGGASAGTDSTNSRVRRKKRGLIDLPEDNDILSKLKEKIRQQQLNASSSDTSSRDDSLLLDHGRGGVEHEPHHVIHDPYDPVSMRPGAHCDGMEKPAITRKIAPVASMPSYKGFSDITTDNNPPRPVSQSVIVKKKVKKPAVNIQPRKYEMYDYPSGGDSGLSSSEKPKKPTRVVAHDRKNTHASNDIITTSSWRAGQELIRQKLGPSRTRKTSSETQKKDVVQPEEQRRPDGAEGHDLWQPVGSSNTGTTGLEVKKVKVGLAQETQKMLEDLHRDTSDDDVHNKNTKNVRSRPAVKRKAPKQTEPEKQQQAVSAKQRHYDQEEVRKFIAKQRAERQKRKKEEEKRELTEHEKRKRHLEELCTKRKSSTQKASTATASKSKQRTRQRSRRPTSEEHIERRLICGESDKENQDTHNNTAPDLDDDSSTLTGDTEDETTPVTTPRAEKKTESKTDGAKPKLLDPKFSVNVDEALSRFSEVVKQRKAQAGLLADSSYQPPTLPTADTEPDLYQRKQAIKDMASSLRSRLKASSQIDNNPTDSHVTFHSSVPTTSNENKEYASRYDRLVGKTEDLFTTNVHLPGTQDLAKRAREVLEENYQKEAAIRIQSAYRGHSARRSLDMTSPNHPHSNTAQRKHRSEDDDSELTPTSTFSEVTPDSENDSLQLLHPKRKDKRHSPVGGACYNPPNKYKWEGPKSDPYSVMNVLNRRSKHSKENYSLNPVEQQIRETISQSTLPPTDPRITSRSGQHYTSSMPAAVNMESNLRPQRVRSQSEVSDDFSARSSVSLRSSVREPKEKTESRQESNKFKSAQDTDGTDTDDSYSNLVESESLRPRSRQKSDHYPSAHLDKSENLSHSEQYNWSSTDKRPASMPSVENIHSMPARYSPNSLDRQMMAELNRLESLEESYRQLAGVERTRAVSLAQQESVSLAQVLKSRQMSHDLEMKKLQLEVQQEAHASNQQLNDIKLRTQGHTTNQRNYTQPASFDMEPQLHSTPAAKSNEQPIRRDVSATHSLTETRGRQSNRDRTDTEDYTESISARKNRDASRVSNTGSSYTSRHSKQSRSSSGSVITAKDSQQDTDSSSIKSASDADGRDESKAESIAEDIPEGDYTLSFDSSITEDESFRQVLPSESHRKEVKRRHQGDDSILNNDEAGTSQLSVGDMSLFVGGDTFSKFTADMVRQLMKEEELRSQHQAAMLRIRETALKKKADAELSWLQQQKHHLRDKGADDVRPQIKKKEKIVLKELHEKQAEIRRLQEANIQANKERQAVLKQQETIAKLHQKKRMAKLQDGLKTLTGRLGRPADIHTEDDSSAFEEGSDLNENFSAKDCKSDSEVITDKKSGKTLKGDKKKLEKQHKLWLNDKYLTIREHKLLNRKKSAEELLAWKKKLDEAEAKVFELEKKALDVWDDNKPTDVKPSNKTNKQDKITSQKANKNEAVSRKESESIVSEQVITARDESNTATSQLSSQRSNTASKDNDGKKRNKSVKDSNSDLSIPEEVPSATDLSVVTPDKQNKINDSSDDTIVNSSVNDEYTNETFEADTSVSRRQKPLKRYLPSGSPLPSPWSRRTGSESESEDSISHTDTVSDTSDYEGRIRHLNDELRRRRKEFEILKKERKQRKKEKLKAQEESLKKQVEAYDNYINQLKHEQSDLELEPPKSVVKPLIKHPSKTKSHVKDDSNNKRQRDQEGSFSSSYEDTINGSDSAQTSPNLSDSRESSKLSPLLDKKKPSFLDRISEGSESAQSGSEKHSKKKDSKDPRSQSSVSEIIEELSQGDSDISDKTDSGLLKIETRLPVGDEVDRTQSAVEDDPSYSMDFTASANSLQNLKPSLSARSDRSASHIFSEKDNSRISEQIDEAISVQSEASRSLKLDLNLKKPDLDQQDSHREKSESAALTGIQESDSENDSHTKSQHTLSYSPTVSRPSSGTERSAASSYGVNFEDEESERTVESESESEKTPVRVPTQVHSTGRSVSQVSEEDISEHISVSLPSLSEKKAGSQRDDTTNRDLDQLLGEMTEEEELTPREENTPLIGEGDTNSLLLTDPLAEFQIGEEVLVWGRKKGTLLYKGKVELAPGIWAGVELQEPEEDQDEQCSRYFKCKPAHGALVPGSEISAIRDDMKPGERKTADDSVTDQEDNSTTTDSELDKVIKETADKVEQFGDKKPPSRDLEALADKLTDQITAELLVDSVNTMGKISDKQTANQKVPPPTLPKPKKQKTVEQKSDDEADNIMTSLVENALTHMIGIRNKKRQNNQTEEPLVNGHIGSESDQSDTGLESAVIKDELQRPLSPVLGGSRSQDVQQLDDDLFNLLGGDDIEDEYFEETLGVSKSAVGTNKTDATKPATPKVEKIVYAVPHEKAEVERIIDNAIDIYWNARRCGEPFTGVVAPESFYDTKDENLTMEKQSEKTYKRMLFDLTGEIICDIYSQEEVVEPLPWEKPTYKRPQYSKSHTPPTTVDNLRPIVQKAVNELLGLNGVRKSDRVKNKFSLHKRRDHVDNILADDLRLEEPGWLDYNSAELDVKHALTDSIFETLLAETVETCTKIHNKRHQRSERDS
ncbi:centrosome-associated protein 350 [Patella vulgata]|uniref:centrosome-associated protein 350 n=1 Tax=Patella vulgata TaxID=6465 RepID=UPI0024A8FD31|nr:centrosome-associated protein 350 [Patella vulgata]